MAEQMTTHSDQPTHERAGEIFQRAYDLLNERDLAHVPAIFTEDLLFEDDAWPEPIRGHEEMRRFLGSVWTAFPDFRFERLHGPYLAQNGGVALHVRVTGTMEGRLDPPGFLPTGARLSIEYGGFYELDGDRIRRARIIVNMNDAAVQIGALPAPGSPGEKVAVLAQGLQARFKRRRAGWRSSRAPSG